MSKIIASAVFRASNKIVDEAEQFLNKAMAEKGENLAFEFPDTGYFLPHYYAMTGIPVKTLGEMRQIITLAKSHLSPVPDESLYKPYLGEALDAGMA
ncbi:MAG TPA: CO dehydrogenase/CO-methylating acetyl-CoA synthase complex subunit beta, partial [Thermodesulfobacteriota bacterium]|nr:CO dehydrogenase/CO-methylating acetyl-CoA synthase complex subunit beta [Thermodesulfobacteriota bacterium]